MKKFVILLLCFIACMSTVASADGDVRLVTNESELRDAVTRGGNIQLTEDIVLFKSLIVRKDVNVDLNGHVLTIDYDIYSTVSSNIFIVNCADGNLQITDSRPDAAHENFDSTLPRGGVILGDIDWWDDYGAAIHISDGGKACLAGGTVCRCTASYGAISIDGGSEFTLDGGTICDCNGYFGGGVAVIDGTFEMTGGTISGCSTAQLTDGQGGGVYVKNGTFIMSGGIIENCTSRERGIYARGGGVHMCGGTRFVMTGGRIRNCRALYGGGVYVGINSLLDIDGGVVESPVLNSGVISGEGIFTDTVTNNGIIASGTFTDKVDQRGVVISGTFCGKYDDRGMAEGIVFTCRDEKSTYILCARPGSTVSELSVPYKSGWSFDSWRDSDGKVLASDVPLFNGDTVYASWALLPQS